MYVCEESSPHFSWIITYKRPVCLYAEQCDVPTNIMFLDLCSKRFVVSLNWMVHMICYHGARSVVLTRLLLSLKPHFPCSDSLCKGSFFMSNAFIMKQCDAIFSVFKRSIFSCHYCIVFFMRMNRNFCSNCQNQNKEYGIKFSVSFRYTEDLIWFNNVPTANSYPLIYPTEPKKDRLLCFILRYKE